MKEFDKEDNRKNFEEFIQNDDYTLERLCHKVGRRKIIKHRRTELLLWLRSFIIVIIAVTVIRGFIGEPVKVFGPSMKDTLITGDILVMSKIKLNTAGIERNDIVVIEIQPVQFKYLKFLNDIKWFRRMFPSEDRADYIKRVIALEGEEIDFINGIVYIDGRRHDEPYLKEYASTFEIAIDMPYTVPKGHVFVLGDNRALSKDSRTIGAIPVDSIIGIVVFRTWPLDKFGVID